MIKLFFIDFSMDGSWLLHYYYFNITSPVPHYTVVKYNVSAKYLSTHDSCVVLVIMSSDKTILIMALGVS